MFNLKGPIKKAAWRGGWWDKTLTHTKYTPAHYLSNIFFNFSQRSRRTPGRANRFEQRRKEQIQKLLVASTPAQRRNIIRGRWEGRCLRQEAEKLQG